jgi:hypothetical protein
VVIEELALFLVGLASGGGLAAARHRLIRGAARAYVYSSELVGEILDPVRHEWQRNVEEARRQRVQSMVRRCGSPEKAEEIELEGEALLKKALVTAERAAVEVVAL